MTTMNQLSDSSMFSAVMRHLLKNFMKIIWIILLPCPAEWREYFDRLAQMPGFVARDVAHAPVIAAFAELAKMAALRQ